MLFLKGNKFKNFSFNKIKNMFIKFQLIYTSMYVYKQLMSTSRDTDE